MPEPREPLLHTGITDSLPPDHPLAWETVYCQECKAMLHGTPNENMCNWVETGKGPWCLPCFTRIFADDYDAMDTLGLPPLSEPGGHHA